MQLDKEQTDWDGAEVSDLLTNDDTSKQTLHNEVETTSSAGRKLGESHNKFKF